MHTSDVVAEQEYNAWQDVVRLLKETGAVTEDDCTSPSNALPATPGQELFVALNWWGRCMRKVGEQSQQASLK